MDDQILLCELGTIRLGVTVSFIERVVSAAALQPVPDAPADLAGILNLHGQIVPVIDLRPLIGIPVEPISPSDCFIILKTDSPHYANTALLVSNCDQVVNAPAWNEPLTIGNTDGRTSLALQLGMLNGQTLFRIDDHCELSPEAENAVKQVLDEQGVE